MIKYNNNTINGMAHGSSGLAKMYYRDNVCYYAVVTEAPPTPVTKDYLRFIARQDGTFSFTTNAIEYSLDSGSTWTSLPASTSTPTIASGDTIYWRASGLTPTSSDGIGTFSSTGQFDVEGNVMSMLFGSDFEDKTDLTGYNYAFKYLFRTGTNIINASGMTLPATTLANYCYYAMFYGCTNLTTASELPAATLATSCYYNMFGYCSSLTTAPVLSATTLVYDCYRGMFNSCSSLSAVTCLATSGIDEINYNNTANWLVNTAANGTFTRAANVNWYCGAIPSTWSVTPAYERTYDWVKAPVTDYVCDTTNHIKYYKEYYCYSDNNGCNWTHVTPESSRTSSDIIERDSVDCGAEPSTDYSKQAFTLVADAACVFKFTTANGCKFSKMQYSTNGGSSWNNYSSGMQKSLSKGQSIQYRFTMTSASTYGIGTFSGSSSYHVEGNARSLWAGSAFTNSVAMQVNCQLWGLFKGQTNLQSAENLVLPSTTLRNYCYYDMFSGCTNMTTAPELPATTLKNYCYNGMFTLCSKLNNIRCYATNKSATGCLTNWVSGVASSGTFTKAAGISISTWGRGNSGIPNNWKVKDK